MANVTTQEDSFSSKTLTPEQRDALWKWRWLGLANSTPAFKASLVLLGAVIFALVAYVAVIGR